MNQPKKIFLLVTTFLSGAVILVLEVLGFRLFAPYFGYSVYVSGSLIGMILGALSVGYLLGGLLSGSAPAVFHALFFLILASALYLVGIYWSAHLILKFFQDGDLIWGVLGSTLIIFAPPMVLLSMISPYMIKLLGRIDRLGTIAGEIYAISTIGSIVGSFLATFYLIPHMGTSATLAGSIVILFLLATLGLALVSKKWIGLAACLVLLFVSPFQASSESVIYQTESLYNNIQVRDHYRQGSLYARALVLNNPVWLSSFKFFSESKKENYLEFFKLAPFLTEVKSALLLGLSGGYSAMELLERFDITIDGVEIDPEVVRVAKEYFGVKESARLKIHVVDAKNYLLTSSKKYDFIEIDLFSGGPFIPFYVATQEFFTQVKDHLNPKGVVMMNVMGNIDKPSHEMLPRSIANTFSKVFPSVYAYPYKTNTILLATNAQTTWPRLASRIKNPPDDLALYAGKLTAGMRPFQIDPRYPVFTDDRAPVAYYTNQFVKAYMAELKARQ